MPTENQLQAFREFDQPSLRRRSVEAGRNFIQDHGIQALVLGTLAIDLCIAGKRAHVVSGITDAIGDFITDLHRDLHSFDQMR